MMLLHQHFVRIPKRYGSKPAFIDLSADRRFTYSKALIAAFILAEKFRRVSCRVAEAPDQGKGAKVVTAVTKPIEEKKIVKQMAGHLPNIALPRQTVVIEELPRTGSGKIDFRAVTEMVNERLRKKCP